jgi:hypothetical protein
MPTGKQYEDDLDSHESTKESPLKKYNSAVVRGTHAVVGGAKRLAKGAIRAAAGTAKSGAKETPKPPVEKMPKGIEKLPSGFGYRYTGSADDAPETIRKFTTQKKKKKLGPEKGMKDFIPGRSERSQGFARDKPKHQ